MSDNVDSPQVEDVTDQVEAEQSQQAELPKKEELKEKYDNIFEARTAVATKTGVETIQCMLNYQIIDGSIVEFVDTEKSLVVAAARLQYDNKLLVNDKTGEMFVPVRVAQLSFARSTISFKQ